MENNIHTYRTINQPSNGIFKDRGSRFLAFAFPVSTEPEIKEIIDRIRKEYFDARHHCFAYRLGPEKKIFRTYDDGEPSSTAGKPILGQILSNDLTDILIVVVRYFGGTLLGVSGLIQAYKSAAADAIVNASVVECKVTATWLIEFEYTAMNDVMKIVKDYSLDTSDQQFELTCRMLVKINKEQEEDIVAKFHTLDHVTLKTADHALS